MPEIPPENLPISQENKREFRGTWIPAEVFFLLEEGKINTPKFALLCVIESLVRARGVGCFATNKQLGQKMGGLQIRQIQQLIHELVEEKLLIRMEDEKYWRLLETTWSRAGKLVQGGQSFAGGDAKLCVKPMQSFASKNSNRRKVFKKYRCPPASAPPQPTGNGVKPKSSFGKLDQSSFSRELSTLIYGKLTKAGKLQRKTTANWTEPIDKLVSELMEKDHLVLLQFNRNVMAVREKSPSIPTVQEYIHSIVSLFLDCLEEPFSPKCWSGTSICERFVEIEDFLRRWLRDHHPNGDKGRWLDADEENVSTSTKVDHGDGTYHYETEKVSFKKFQKGFWDNDETNHQTWVAQEI